MGMTVEVWIKGKQYSVEYEYGCNPMVRDADGNWVPALPKGGWQAVDDATPAEFKET